MTKSITDRLHEAGEILRGMDQEAEQPKPETQKERGYRLWQEAKQYREQVNVMTQQRYQARAALVKRVQAGMNPAEIPAMAAELSRLNVEFELYDMLAHKADQEVTRLEQDYAHIPDPAVEEYNRKAARLREIERALNEYDPTQSEPLDALINELDRLKKDIGPLYVTDEQLTARAKARQAEHEARLAERAQRRNMRS